MMSAVLPEAALDSAGSVRSRRANCRLPTRAPVLFSSGPNVVAGEGSLRIHERRSADLHFVAGDREKPLLIRAIDVRMQTAIHVQHECLIRPTDRVRTKIGQGSPSRGCIFV